MSPRHHGPEKDPGEGRRPLIDPKAIVNGLIASALFAGLAALWKLVGRYVHVLPRLPWPAILVGAVSVQWLVGGWMAPRGLAPEELLIRLRAMRRGERGTFRVFVSRPPDLKLTTWDRIGDAGFIALILGPTAAVWLGSWFWPLGYAAVFTAILTAVLTYVVWSFAYHRTARNRLSQGEHWAVIAVTSLRLLLICAITIGAPLTVRGLGWLPALLIAGAALIVARVGVLLRDRRRRARRGRDRSPQTSN
jgi:hypothetical protein